MTTPRPTKKADALLTRFSGYATSRLEKLGYIGQDTHHRFTSNRRLPFCPRQRGPAWRPLNSGLDTRPNGGPTHQDGCVGQPIDTERQGLAPTGRRRCHHAPVRLRLTVHGIGIDLDGAGGRVLMQVAQVAARGKLNGAKRQRNGQRSKNTGRYMGHLRLTRSRHRHSARLHLNNVVTRKRVLDGSIT